MKSNRGREASEGGVWEGWGTVWNTGQIQREPLLISQTEKQNSEVQNVNKNKRIKNPTLTTLMPGPT